MAKKFSNVLSMFDKGAKKEKDENIGALFSDEANPFGEPSPEKKQEAHPPQQKNLHNKVLMFGGGGPPTNTSTAKKPPDTSKENQLSNKMKMFENKKEDKKPEDKKQEDKKVDSNFSSKM